MAAAAAQYDCKFGAGCKYQSTTCKFKHPIAESKLCKYFAAGACKYGSKCESAHDAKAILHKEQTWLKEHLLFPGVKTPMGVQTPLIVQPRYIVVLDWEGQEEIIEFPALILDLKYHCEKRGKARFHRWIAPTFAKSNSTVLSPVAVASSSSSSSNSTVASSETTAMPFAQALVDFHAFLALHGLTASNMHHWCFVTCGDWDLKTQLPKQCNISKCSRPVYFDKWCNVKDLWNASCTSKPVVGMTGLLKHLGLALDGTHHLGMDDVTNIAKCVMLIHKQGISIQATSTRKPCTAQVCSFGGGCRNSHRDCIEPSPVKSEVQVTASTTTATTAPATAAMTVVSDEKAKFCVVCYTNMATHIVLDCMHFCLCRDCVTATSLTTCPMCRAPIASIKKVF